MRSAPKLSGSRVSSIHRAPPMPDFLASIPAIVRRCLRADTLTGFAVISVQGTDAVSFLHAQLTQDVQGLDDRTARLAGYCTAKGRLLATLVVWRARRTDPDIRLLVRADAAQSLIKRLSMFVLRSKVTLTLAPVTVMGINVALEQAEALGQALDASLSAEPWQRAHTAHGDWLTAPSADPSRLRGWLIADTPNDAAQSAGDAWHADDIAAGLPWIGLATQDLFIPQTVNLELLGGVNFTKGCYPGQEVVARSHYRGTIKRRMAGGVVADAGTQVTIVPGADVFQASRPDEPCGRIVDIATTHDITRVLFEAPFNAVDADDLHVSSPDGPALHIVALPYATRN